MAVTIEALVDHRGVEEVLLRYASSLDDRDWDRLRTCFLPEARAEYEGIGGCDGYEAIEAVCRAALEPLHASQHLVSNIEATVDGDRATARCYFQAQHVRRGVPGGDNYVIAGRYDDVLVRHKGSWRIARRELHVIWTEGNPAVVGAEG